MFGQDEKQRNQHKNAGLKATACNENAVASHAKRDKLRDPCRYQT
jgi:hypothetical protein